MHVNVGVSRSVDELDSVVRRRWTRSRKSAGLSVSKATTNSWSSRPNEYEVLRSTLGYSRPTRMCSCMIRQRSSAGRAYQARVLTNGYTNRYLPCAGRTSRRDSSEYSEGLVIASSEYGTVHHFISPLWARTTWNS